MSYEEWIENVRLTLIAWGHEYLADAITGGDYGDEPTDAFDGGVSYVQYADSVLEVQGIAREVIR